MNVNYFAQMFSLLSGSNANKEFDNGPNVVFRDALYTALTNVLGISIARIPYQYYYGNNVETATGGGEGFEEFDVSAETTSEIPFSNVSPTTALSNAFSTTALSNVFPTTEVANVFPTTEVANVFPTTALSNAFPTTAVANAISTTLSYLQEVNVSSVLNVGVQTLTLISLYYAFSNRLKAPSNKLIVDNSKFEIQLKNL
jgi:hypothetical protein